MEPELQEYLLKRNINYRLYKHPAVFTVKESESLPEIKNIPGLRTKSLFLKDENSHFYLITLPGKKMLNTKILKKYFKIKELHFSSQKELYNELNVSPGSVSLFCIINAKKATLVLDKEVFDSEQSGFHPNINTATIVLDKKNIKKFYDSLDCKKEIIAL